MTDEPWEQRLAGLPTHDRHGVTVHVADTFRARRRGLARMTPLPPGRALLIAPCRSVHTFRMRFALDLTWLDAHGEVVREDRAVPPNRVRTCLRARAVLESPTP
ncbi:MAG TPA: DUF192 domain-containing protein [Solirubrobacteraceae bacterium]